MVKKLIHHPALKQWAWFIVLWSLGLLAVSILAYSIKLLIYMAP
jgi:hypothetical protein